jgi:hypothetical protein
VVSVEVTPPQLSFDFLGESIQLSARALDAAGNTVSGETFAWASSASGVVSVDADGVATALSEGSATIRATLSSGISGSSSAVVSPVECAPREVDLGVGEAVALPVDCPLILPAGTDGDRYRVTVVNLDTSVEGLTSPAPFPVSVTVSPMSTAAGAVWSGESGAGGRFGAPGTTGRMVASPTGEDDRREPLSIEQIRHLRMAENLEVGTRAHHARLRAAEDQLLTPLLARSADWAGGADRTAAANRIGGDPGLLATDGLVPTAQELPSSILLRANSGFTCDTVAPLRPALVIGQNDVAAVLQDSVQYADPERRITPEQARAILDYYAAYGVSVIDEYFTGIPDLDGNGKFLIFTSFSEPLDQPSTAAYAWAGDLLPTGLCPASNEAEMAYFNADLIQAITERNFQQALPTSVHEAKHVASFWHGRARGRYQPTWIEEGTAEVAGEVSSRRAWGAVGGPAANARITADDFRTTGVVQGPTGQRTRPEALGVEIRLRRTQDYLASQPNGVVQVPSGADPRHSIYGSGWVFFRWLGDVYGAAAGAPGADAALFRSQVDSTTAAGISGVSQVTGVPFSELLIDFAQGVSLHTAPGEDPATDFTSYDFVDTVEWFCWAADNPSCLGESPGPAGSFPWPVTAGSDGVMGAPFDSGLFSGTVGGTGLRIHEFVSDGTGSGLSVIVSASQPARVVVARIN